MIAIDGISLVTTLWALTSTALMIFILALLYKLLGDASRRHLHAPSLEFKVVLLGTSVIDVASLCLTDVSLVSTRYFGNNDGRSVYCADMSWMELLVNAYVWFVFIATIVWLRHGALLRDATRPIRGPIVDQSPSGNARPVNGLPWWFVVLVSISLVATVLVDLFMTYESDLTAFSLCITEPVTPSWLLATIVVSLHIIWWPLTMLTTSILKRGQLRNKSAVFGISHQKETRGLVQLSDSTQEDVERKPASQLTLFLIIASIWYSPVQCFILQAVFDFSTPMRVRAMFLTWMYSSTAPFFSLVLSVYVCIGLRDDMSIIADDIAVTIKSPEGGSGLAEITADDDDDDDYSVHKLYTKQ
ncbi:hypothetical protein LSH36_1385g00028 [Paralvinella palmiformis]|uniref:Uncharacterized protein n=1 Tax=Paralvinella palmiformis TaxID=53620 RepID=A0AAD9ITK4_9ANNE|nr:hypothetical protein LSH36_1385g00028 [Paralvinella palmiformis]